MLEFLLIAALAIVGLIFAWRKVRQRSTKPCDSDNLASKCVPLVKNKPKTGNPANVGPAKSEPAVTTPAAKVVASQPATVVDAGSALIPEDAVLRRHYLAQKEAEGEDLINPYPTDSVLRRHYDSMKLALLDLNAASCSASTKVEVAVSTPVVEAVVVATEAAAESFQLPEDSVLRRHFLAQLQSEVESEYSPEPTDAVLKRHYEQLVQTLLADRVAGLA